ncbi:MAG: hypothetical protein GTO14_14860 [Anaerolineales bacterium]|nr:hypothetical protein [Anaerolineales bacterium]
MSDFLLFVVVLGTLLLGHELGHFIAARLARVRVEEFGIGFPPRLLTLFEAGGTKFTFNLIPFGGFNRIAGEDDPDVPNGLLAASKRVRAAIYLAGPIANIFLGFLAFVLAFKFAAPDLEKVMITDLVDGAPAQVAGIREGDLVRSVSGQPVTGFDSMLEAVQAHLGTPVEIELERDGEPFIIELIPRVEYPEGQGPIGVTLGHPAKQTSWLEATQIGAESIGLQVNALLSLPGRILQGVAQPEETRVVGLKGIHDMLTLASSIDRSAQRPYFTLNFIGAISIGLALANLLPFPALDGGRILFLLFETLLGQRISPRFEVLIHAIGFAILIALMVYINLQDFINPVELPR